MRRLLGLIEDVGAVAGIVSFIAVSALLVLYLVKAREIRQLLHHAPFLADGGRPTRSARRRISRTR
jgi:hypothetical protein